MTYLSRSEKYINIGLLVIRAGLGLLFIYHGYPKLTGGTQTWEHIGGAMGSVGIHFLPVFWGFAAAVTEAVGGLLIILGILFRPACLLLLINLAIAAIFTYKHSGSFGDATHAIEDAIAFAGLFFTGPGLYSLSGRLKRNI